MSKKVLYVCDICGDEIKPGDTLFEISVEERTVLKPDGCDETSLTYNGIYSQLFACKKCWCEGNLMTMYNLSNEQLEK